jgi:purine-nucleoside phosphorylase
MAETKDNLARLRERGFDAVDLELSAVYAAAQKSGIKASSLLAVSDLPMDDVFAVNAPREAKKKYRDSIREIAVGAVDFITGECSL